MIDYEALANQWRVQHEVAQTTIAALNDRLRDAQKENARLRELLTQLHVTDGRGHYISAEWKRDCPVCTALNSPRGDTQ